MVGLVRSQMVDSNAGFEVGLMGGPIRFEIRDLKAAGVGILTGRFEDTEQEFPRFADLVRSFMDGKSYVAATE